LGFFHGDMVDSLTSIVLLGSNKNRIGSIGRGRCLRRVSMWIGALVGIVTSFSTSIALLFSG
jgi:hypothetical protein